MVIQGEYDILDILMYLSIYAPHIENYQPITTV